MYERRWGCDDVVFVVDEGRIRKKFILEKLPNSSETEDMRKIR